jgi:hypothetical protein
MKKKSRQISSTGIHIEGDVIGSALGEEARVEADQIAKTIVISDHAASATPEEFIQQLEALLILVGRAVRAKEIPSNRDADDVVQALQRVLEMAQEQNPPKNRIVRRLEDVGDVLSATAGAAQAAGKIGAAVIKAVPIIAGLIQLAQIVF